ncbi:Uncharacterised protein [Weeksella virosa]|nr:Uncharacterised protein [Weeksella virosa]
MLSFLQKTNCAGPSNHTCSNAKFANINCTDKSPPTAFTCIGSCDTFPAEKAAIAAAVTPVPQAKVSASTPRSYFGCAGFDFRLLPQNSQLLPAQNMAHRTVFSHLPFGTSIFCTSATNCT